MAGNLKKGGGAAAALLALAVTYIGVREGVRTVPYRDPGGVLTVCWGETHVPMRRYTLDECKVMFKTALTKVYGAKLEECVTRPMSIETEVAFLDTAYNAGWQGTCQSPAIRLWNAGHEREACDALNGWHVSQRGVGVLPGLVHRRKDAVELCLRGLGKEAN
jgi:lysozyme